MAAPKGVALKRVFVNGYGSIGSRIASFLADDPQVELMGVGRHTPGSRAGRVPPGIDFYVPEAAMQSFAGAAGSIESAVRRCDLVIDASPGGCGYRNKRDLYEPAGVPAIYQGGESVTGPEAVSDLLFNSRSNYGEAAGRTHVMQGSCNVTGMGRILEPLRERYGRGLVRLDLTLVRRWADLEQGGKEVPDTIEITPRPHHGEDAKSYLGSDAPLHVRAVKVPTRQMHLHMLDARFAGPAPAPAEVHALFAHEPGVATLWGAMGTAQVRDCARDMGFSFVDTNMVHIHADMTSASGDTLQMMYSDDQTGIVIPENHMLMQAMLFGRTREEAAAHTDAVFHTAEKKRRLEERFSPSAARS